MHWGVTLKWCSAFSSKTAISTDLEKGLFSCQMACAWNVFDFLTRLLKTWQECHNCLFHPERKKIYYLKQPYLNILYIVKEIWLIFSINSSDYANHTIIWVSLHLLVFSNMYSNKIEVKFSLQPCLIFSLKTKWENCVLIPDIPSLLFTACIRKVPGLYYPICY